MTKTVFLLVREEAEGQYDAYFYGKETWEGDFFKQEGNVVASVAEYQHYLIREMEIQA